MCQLLPQWFPIPTLMGPHCLLGFRGTKEVPKRRNRGETEEMQDLHGSFTGFRFVHLNPYLGHPDIFNVQNCIYLCQLKKWIIQRFQIIRLTGFLWSSVPCWFWDSLFLFLKVAMALMNKSHGCCKCL